MTLWRPVKGAALFDKIGPKEPEEDYSQGDQCHPEGPALEVAAQYGSSSASSHKDPQHQ